MMEEVMTISGKVKYKITLDPATWIFDDRRVDLTTYFSINKIDNDPTEEYTKAVSKHWDREIMEGAIFPPTLKTEKKYEKEKMLTGTFGIPFRPFLQNSEPASDTGELIIHSKDGDYTLPLNIAAELIVKFSENGKPLTADGPVHIYFGDGSNQHHPIRKVTGFTVN